MNVSASRLWELLQNLALIDYFNLSLTFINLISQNAFFELSLFLSLPENP